MTKLHRDPLIHFIGLGVLLFVAHALWTQYVSKADRQLVIDTRVINQQSELFFIQNGRAPTDAELQGIIVSYVEEEVLAREAKALGLDNDDTVIRNRLAQKMRFVTDAGPVSAPDDAGLRDYWLERQALYSEPERRVLQHVFYSESDRQDVQSDAVTADLSNWQTQGDPFLLGREIGPLSYDRIAQDYGLAFADKAFGADLDVWTDPVASPFGIHRIRVTRVLPLTTPDFSDVRDQVLTDWVDETRQQRAADILRARVAKYDVIIEESALSESQP